MDDNVSMLIEGMIVNAKDALWTPYYQLTNFDLEVSEGVQRDMMLAKLDALDKRSAELRELISPHVPDNDESRGWYVYKNENRYQIARFCGVQPLGAQKYTQVDAEAAASRLNAMKDHYNPATPDNDTVSRLAAADAEIAADQDFDKKGHEREYKIGPEAL